MPMELGDPARKGIVGHDLDYYLNQLNETREKNGQIKLLKSRLPGAKPAGE
jgi:hypothetical protein